MTDAAKLLAGATEGPWIVEEDFRVERDFFTREEHSYLAGYNIHAEGGEIVGCEGIIPGDASEANARLIAAAHTLATEHIALTAEVERLKAENNDLRAADRVHLSATRGMEARLTAEVERLTKLAEGLAGALRPVASVEFLGAESNFADDDLVMVSVGAVRSARAAITAWEGRE